MQRRATSLMPTPPAKSVNVIAPFTGTLWARSKCVMSFRYTSVLCYSGISLLGGALITGSFYFDNTNVVIEYQIPRTVEQVIELLASSQGGDARLFDVGRQAEVNGAVSIEGWVWQAVLREIAVDALGVHGHSAGDPALGCRHDDQVVWFLEQEAWLSSSFTRMVVTVGKVLVNVMTGFRSMFIHCSRQEART
jgi:hypothetical protein